MSDSLATILSRLPAPWHRTALRLAQRVRLRWWRWRRPEIHGCRLVVENPRGHILLVRHSYSAPELWTLPGGGIGAGEDRANAALRELREETGCRAPRAVPFGREFDDSRGARNHIHLFAAATEDEPQADGREIVEARFFPAETLPEPTGRATLRHIAQWRKLKEQA